MTWLWGEGGCAHSRHSRHQGWGSNCIAGNKKLQSTGSTWTAEFMWATGASVTIQMLCAFWHCLHLSLLLKGTHTAAALQFHCFVFCNNILHGLCHVEKQTELLKKDILSSSRVPLDHKQGQIEQIYSLPHGSQAARRSLALWSAGAQLGCLPGTQPCGSIFPHRGSHLSGSPSVIYLNYIVYFTDHPQLINYSQMIFFHWQFYA